MTPQQLAHKVLADKQLEKVAKTSHVVQVQKANQPQRVLTTPKRSQQALKSTKQVENTNETPSNNDQVKLPFFSSSSMIFCEFGYGNGL